MRQDLTLCIYTIVWYLSATITVTTSTSIMKALPLPMTLCTLQFMITTVALHILLGDSRCKLGAEWATVAKLAFVHTLGFFLTNACFSVVNASLAETVKASEPLTTVILSALFIPNEGASKLIYLTLVPIMCGVAMSAMGDTSFNFLGLGLALGSNVCFSARPIFTRQLRWKFAKAVVAQDDINMFYHLSRYGLVMLIPISLMWEGRRLLSFISGESTPPMLSITPPQPPPASSSSAENSASPLFGLLWLGIVVLLNGICYAMYNQMSYLVLSRVAVVTHAVLNVLRRAVIIVTTAIVFQVKITPINVSGVVCAVGGSVLFALAKKSKPKFKEIDGPEGEGESASVVKGKDDPLPRSTTPPVTVEFVTGAGESDSIRKVV